MIPILYSSDERDFITNGLGALSDVISCVVTEERNGEYELEMEYPIVGRHYSDISYTKIIFAKPSDGKEPQPFSIYKISKPMNGVVTINAEHISYQLNHIPVNPFVAKGPVNTMNALDSHVADECPFTVFTDMTDNDIEFAQTKPGSFREYLGGVENSILDTFGGEIEWDRYQVKLLANRGVDNGVRIAYGKNLIDVNQEGSIENTITSVYPYWQDQSQTTLVTCGVISSSAAANFPYKRTSVVDFSSVFEIEPTIEELRQAAEMYIEAAEIGSPEVSLKVEFIPLWQTEEYKNIACLERVNLCDTVIVEFPELGVQSTAKVSRARYNVLIERYIDLELGSYKNSLDRTIGGIAQDIKNTPTISFLEYALKVQADLITGGLGGNVIVNRDANGRPIEVIFGDTDNIATMRNCLRVNMNGIAFSQKGYSGPFNSAWTIDGTLNMENIKVINFTADLIKGGTLTLGGEDNGSGTLEVLDNSGKQILKVDNNGIQYKDSSGNVTVAVTGVTNYYYISTSDIELKDGEWSTIPPSQERGKYIWTKTITTYASGPDHETLPVCITGAKGDSGQDAILLRIDSSRGVVFKNNQIGTVLNVSIFYGGQRIEDGTTLHSVLGNSAYLEWQWLKQDGDSYGTISSSDSRLSNDGFTFTVSPEDVDIKTTFRCNLIMD